MPEVMEKRPLRWRISEAFEGPRGWLYILAIAAAFLAAILVPYVFRPFVGRPEIKQDDLVIQTEIRCLSPYTEVTRSIDVDADAADPRRVCVDNGRTRVFLAGAGSFFVLIFTGIALLSRAGKIQPKEPTR